MGTGDEANFNLLREAIARRAGMVLSLPLGGRLRHHKSRFLADAGDGFWVESIPAESELLHDLINRQEPAGISFRRGQTKVVFATHIQHCKTDYVVTGGENGDAASVEALLLRFPDVVKAVQRRKTFRVPVASTADLQLKLWTMPESAGLRDKPSAARELVCEARDISVAGLGVTIKGSGGKPPNVAIGERLRIQLTMRDLVVVLEGRLRHPPKAAKDNGSAFRAGIQFRVLGESREDRQASADLNRIVSELQREAIRRHKLGL